MIVNGANTPPGGAGDDLYIVSSILDEVIELPGGGTDTVQASIDYVLPDNVENLLLVDPATSGAGNALANMITGNALDNTLRGGGGADTLAGLGGRDVFVGLAQDFLAGDEIYGGDGRDTLRIEDYIAADLTGVTIQSVEVLEALGKVSLTAAQANAFGAITAGVLAIADAGEVDLAGKSVVVSEIALAAGAHLVPGALSRPLTVSGAPGASVTLSDGTLFSFDAAHAVARIGTSGDDLLALASVIDGGAGYDTLDIGLKGNVDFRTLTLKGVEALSGFLATATVTAAQFNALRKVDVLTVAVEGTGSLKVVQGASVTLLNGGMEMDWRSADFRMGVNGSAGADIVRIGVKGGEVSGNGGNDRLIGGVGADVLSGGDGDDFLSGRAGADRLSGGLGRDEVYGGAGDDIIAISNVGLIAGEIYSGGEGRDTLLVSGVGNAQTVVDLTQVQITGMQVLRPDFAVRMTAAQLRQFDSFNVGTLYVSGTDRLDLGDATGYVGVIRLETPSARLSLAGFAGTTAVIGSAGADSIVAADGGSELKGGGGDDRLHGGIGADKFVGGAGADRFYFAQQPTGTVDTIADFAHGIDQVRIDDAAFAGMGPLGRLASAAFHIGSTAHDADDRIVYDAATGALYFDADGTGAVAQVQFAKLAAGLALAATDFVVI